MKFFRFWSALAVVCAGSIAGNAHGQLPYLRGPSQLPLPPVSQSPAYTSYPAYAPDGSYGAPTYNYPNTNVYSAVQPSAAPTYSFAATPASAQVQPSYAAPQYSGPAYSSPSYNAVQPQWPYARPADGQMSVMLNRAAVGGDPQPVAPQYPVPGPTPGQYDAGPMQNYAAPGHGYPNYGTSAMQAYPNDCWANPPASLCPRPCVWFGGAGGLFMTRDDSCDYRFSFGTGNEADQRTSTRDAKMNTSGGVEARLGRYFNCGTNGIELLYWGLYPQLQTTYTQSSDVSGNLNAILNFDQLDYAGVNAGTFVNVAPGVQGIHGLERNWNFHNFEVNLWEFGSPMGAMGYGASGCGDMGCAPARSRINWLFGVRYFRFDEGLIFGSDAFEPVFDDDPNELLYCINVQNNLVGFQVGGDLQHCLSPCWTAQAGTKLGIYGNHIQQTQEIRGTQGTAIVNNGPFAGEAFSIDSTKSDVAMLGELNAGLSYCFHSRWTATFGVRAVGVTGVAAASDQIYPDLRGLNDLCMIDSCSALILYGGYGTLSYCW